MSARFLRQGQRKTVPLDVIPEDLTAELVPASRACCCPARPVVRVIMPPTADRPHETDLLLCGHHYRASRQALAAAHATVCDLGGLPSDVPVALLPSSLHPSVRASCLATATTASQVPFIRVQGLFRGPWWPRRLAIDVKGSG